MTNGAAHPCGPEHTQKKTRAWGAAPKRRRIHSVPPAEAEGYARKKGDTGAHSTVTAGGKAVNFL